VKGGYVSLSNYKRTQNVLLSFVPAAFTPACSQQWPGYNIAREYFDRANTTVIGISVDNIPSLFAWIREMGDLWFPVLSDFWPHGAVAQAYGVLRSDGVSERALFLIDRTGVIRYMDVHDINKAPKLDALVRELEKLVHWRPGLAPLYRGDAYSMNAMVPWRSRFLDSRPRVNPWLR
jgi:peroxiredoxin (alkyl hydroperoxide reductase subunit C)